MVGPRMGTVRPHGIGGRSGPKEPVRAGMTGASVPCLGIQRCIHPLTDSNHLLYYVHLPCVERVRREVFMCDRCIPKLIQRHGSIFHERHKKPMSKSQKSEKAGASATLILTAISVILFSGCFPYFYYAEPILDEALNVIEDNSPPPEAWSGLSFKDTALYGLYYKYPYDENLPFEQQFPRVALTVLDAPPTQSDKSSLFRTKSCWKLRAKIWSSRTSSQDVEAFHWCTPRDIAGELPLEGADIWFSIGQPSKDICKTCFKYENTGNLRTEGPVPPRTSIPFDLRHQKFWQSSGFGIRQMNGLMLASLLYHMGFDWSVVDDRRVWVVEFIQARS